VIDPDFERGLSVIGKATVTGTEFDYRPELKAIATKIHMWMIMNDSEQVCENTRRMKVQELLQRGEQIGQDEFHPAEGGFPFSYVGGSKYDEWMAEINIFCERHLKTHPSYKSMCTFYRQRSNNPNAYEGMMAQLKVVNSDDEFWRVEENLHQDNHERKEKSMSEKTKVFIVHGHDESIKQVVARFLEKCDLEAIILHEQADGGRTIVEKIEKYTDVEFAVVLYTTCDIGRAKEERKGKPRARQNVVFEHGYLIGRLGRDKVCALVQEGVEIHGDMSGVVYKPLDSAGAWKTSVLKEMKNAGITVDASKLL
jgi:predicted nucleotide-binding protein